MHNAKWWKMLTQYTANNGLFATFRLPTTTRQYVQEKVEI